MSKDVLYKSILQIQFDYWFLVFLKFQINIYFLQYVDNADLIEVKGENWISLGFSSPNKNPNLLEWHPEN